MDLQKHAANEPQASKDFNKIDLLQNFSQEIRSPINTIIGFASLLKNNSLPKGDRDHFVNQIISNGDRVLQILENTFQMSKPHMFGTQREPALFNVSEMVYDVVHSLTPVAGQKKIDIYVVFRNPIPETITSDPLKIRQILTNILGNAIRYSGGEGFILVSLDYQASEGASSNFVLEIDDSAVRASDVRIHADFDQQGGPQSGLNQAALLHRPGLILSQKFAADLGGELVVRLSELGEGHCFSLMVPTGDIGSGVFLKKRKTPSLKKKIVNTLKRSNRLKNVRILLAEDSSISEILISSYLGKEGADLTFVSNGIEAIDAVKNQTFDLILMDIQMPVLDGLEATRQIRQLGFQNPIIAMTGQAFRDDVEKSLVAGCDTHLTKPVSKEALIAEIQKRVFN